MKETVNSSRAGRKLAEKNSLKARTVLNESVKAL